MVSRMFAFFASKEKVYILNICNKSLDTDNAFVFNPEIEVKCLITGEFTAKFDLNHKWEFSSAILITEVEEDTQLEFTDLTIEGSNFKA